MTPPRKRGRPTSPAADEDPAITNCIKLHSYAVKGFLDELDTIESTKPMDSMKILSSASSMLVDVKSSQRDLFKLLDSVMQDRASKRDELERKKLLLQNLAYEKNHLKAQLDACKEYPTPHLERMSRDELCDEVLPAVGVINLFLCGTSDKSIQDPKNHKTIMTTLHKELNARGSLQRDLEKAQSSLTKRKLVAEKQAAFLKDIPKKLAMIERSSIPLQEFFQTSPTTNTLRLIRSARKRRLDLAKSLPSPLYSLFVQIQTYLDNSEGNEQVLLEISRRSKGKHADEVSPDPQVVHLSFAIPDIQAKEGCNAKKNRVTVEFAFVHEYSLVTARSFGFNEKINIHMLLTNLFPGDTGVWIGQPDVSTRLSGEPYHWCNFLSGLYVPPPQQSVLGIHLSTKAVVREIEKRVRANATLTQILSAFEKKKPVAHPSFTDKFNVSDCCTKLTDWKVVDEGDGTEKETMVYAATIKNERGTLSARVVVNWCQYPTVRPSWLLCEGEEAWVSKHGSVLRLHGGTNSLYSYVVGQIESQINGDTPALSDKTDLSSFDWIIAHQLITMIRLWDEAKDRDKVLIKGRDRVGRI
jgi:Fms-interacting protein/Thoc5